MKFVVLLFIFFSVIMCWLYVIRMTDNRWSWDLATREEWIHHEPYTLMIWRFLVVSSLYLFDMYCLDPLNLDWCQRADLILPHLPYISTVSHLSIGRLLSVFTHTHQFFCLLGFLWNISHDLFMPVYEFRDSLLYIMVVWASNDWCELPRVCPIKWKL